MGQPMGPPVDHLTNFQYVKYHLIVSSSLTALPLSHTPLSLIALALSLVH